MDANNDRNSCEGNEETTEELLAIGGENLSTLQVEAGEECKLDSTPQTTQKEGPQIDPTDRTNEIGGASERAERGERCSCNDNSSNFTSAGVPRNQCTVCGGEVVNTRNTNTTNFNKSTTNPDASDNELSEGSEDTRSVNEEFLAFGREGFEADSYKAGSEDSKTEIPLTPQVRTSKRGPSKTCERCSCSKVNSSFQLSSGALQIQCMFCGGEVINTSPTNTTKLEKSTANPSSTVHQDHLFNVLTQSYAVSLPSLPDTSLEDGACCGSQQAEAIVTGHVPPRQQKTPVDNVCELFVQVPSPGMVIRIFLLERTYPERNEKRFFLYMIPEGECEVYEEILSDFKDAAIIHQGFSRQISFTVNNGRSQDFHTLYIQERITVAFEIENRFQENFVALNERDESVFRVPIIKSDSQSRLAKGSKCQFMVQYVGEPGKPCQEQGKITLTIDSTDQTTMFFSIAIWSSVDIHVEGHQPGEQ